jgi:hypothetical protein
MNVAGASTPSFGRHGRLGRDGPQTCLPPLQAGGHKGFGRARHGPPRASNRACPSPAGEPPGTGLNLVVPFGAPPWITMTGGQPASSARVTAAVSRLQPPRLEAGTSGGRVMPTAGDPQPGHARTRGCFHHGALAECPSRRAMMLATWGNTISGPRYEGLSGFSTWSVVNVHFAWVAQSVEQRTRNAQVVGSSPTSGSKCAVQRADKLVSSALSQQLSQQFRRARR